MSIKEAIESLRNSLFWGNWSNQQADAIRTYKKMAICT